MKIKNKKSAYDSSVELPPMKAWARIHMPAFFKDSRVQEIWLDEQCVLDLNQWVMASLSSSPIKEVGGFLLGRSMPGDITSLEHFVPAMATEFSSPTRLTFSEADILALDRQLEENPGWCLTGWFHTHPGHTPYLSDIDLSTHLGFFRAPYMVAMVLDPKTANHDTGMFVQKRDGQMNNQDDAQQWFLWKKLKPTCEA
ncbi:MAG: Mov34/MPN/PAD-1 family protein [Bacteroidota bacterium]